MMSARSLEEAHAERSRDAKMAMEQGDPDKYRVARGNSISQQSILAQAEAMASSRGLLNSAMSSGADAYRAQMNMEKAKMDAQLQAKRYERQQDDNQLVKGIVNTVSMQLSRVGEIEIGGDVTVTMIVVEQHRDSFDETLRFYLVQPDGRRKVFQGPVHSFRGCNNLKEIVLRALTHGKDT